MRKDRIFELFVCMLFMGSFFVVASDTLSADQDSNYTYTINNGEVTITDYACAGGAITIPSTLGGYPTIAIGENAFNACNFLTSVTIPNSVTTIGNKAFKSCTSLTSITIPNSVTTIGDQAFYYCSSVTTLTIGNNVTTIGDDAFSFCSSLASVTIPDSVTTIGASAFSSCISITTVTIGNNVSTIGGSAFASCTSLITVTIPNSVTTIGKSAFQSCTSLATVTIGNRVKTIGSSAFASCTSLTSITFLGLVAPTTFGTDWIKGTPTEIRGHAFAASNFPTTEETWHDLHGLKMGTVISVENILPLAVFTWMPSNLTLNQTVAFDASASDDPDGSLILYEWDWNNDSIYEESHTNPTAIHSWTQAGHYPVTVRVTDNDNSTSAKTITVAVSNGSETNNKGTPGFEFVFVLCAIAVSILLWNKKRNV
jgi:BspA type Leucine rich repeat region (6 copies)/PKD domain